VFVPKGCLPLTTAVDQLAEARRPAGQTNDDGKNAARVELRVELHSGSMSTMVVSPSSGKTFAIRPHHWGRDIALTWLEQGECLLTEGLVDPPWSWLGGDERAKIFVSQDEFQRLVAKQEGKQDPVPHPNPLSPRKRVSEADAIRKFDEWRRSCGDDIPSVKEDIAHMKLHGVSRRRVRELRERPGVELRKTGKRRLP
jgi:hypothetical protein